MNVGKRLLDLARANLSSLLERGDRALKDFSDEEIAAELKRREEKKQREEEERRTAEREELEAKRRAAARKSHEAEEAARTRAATGSSAAARAKTSSSSRTSTSTKPPPRSTSSASARSSKPNDTYTPPPKQGSGKIDPKRLRDLYAKLEVPYNAPYEDVKSGFRRLMRKYHPDLHVGDPKKHKAATELSMSLTAAYRELEAHLKKP